MNVEKYAKTKGILERILERILVYAKGLYRRGFGLPIIDKKYCLFCNKC